MAERATAYGGEPVRVAFVSDSMPERNGVGAYYADLIDQLDGQGFAPTFVCPGGATSGGFSFPLPGDSTQQVFVPSPREFRRIMTRLEPKVIVVATPGPYGMLGVRWARKLGVRLIVGFHTDYAGVTDLYQRSVLRVFSRGYFRVVDRLMFRYADHVLANSAQMIEQAEAMGARKVSRVGTLLPRSVLETPLVPPRSSFGRVLFAGRLAMEKRLHTVLEAAERLPDIRFVIAGDGPLKGEVEAAAARLDNLDYLGWLTRPQLLQQMDAADALVLPSELESFGNVALEAMGRGRIAVVTDTCGIVNWPNLAEHMMVFALETPLWQVLDEMSEWPPQRRIALSEGASRAARKLNRDSLLQWRQLLAPHTCPDHCPEP
ncbi:MAG TPA: glycosyltransferase [Wenzhouxiangellaceae bacterium]|nr:glycosyltransferase [Wenzhouxiangellaceae bacterium]